MTNPKSNNYGKPLGLSVLFSSFSIPIQNNGINSLNQLNL